VLSYEERKAIVRGYAAKAGFAKEQVNKAGKVAWFKNYDIPVVPDLKEVASALSQVKAATA